MNEIDLDSLNSIANQIFPFLEPKEGGRIQLVCKVFHQVWKSSGNLSAQLEAEFLLFKKVNVELIIGNNNPLSLESKQFPFLIAHISNNLEDIQNVIGHIRKNRTDNPYLIDAVREISYMLTTKISTKVFSLSMNEDEELELAWNRVGEKAMRDLLSNVDDRTDSLLVDEIFKLFELLTKYHYLGRRHLLYSTVQVLGERKEFLNQIEKIIFSTKEFLRPTGFEVLHSRKNLIEDKEARQKLLITTICFGDRVGVRELLTIFNFDSFSSEEVEELFELVDCWEIFELLMDSLKMRLQAAELSYSGILVGLISGQRGLCEKYISEYLDKISREQGDLIERAIYEAILQDEQAIFEKLIQIESLELSEEMENMLLRSAAEPGYEEYQKILMDSRKLHGVSHKRELESPKIQESKRKKR